MSMAYLLGIIVGIGLCVVVFAALAYFAKKVGRHGPCEYDERQELIRGRGFKYGFITLLIYNFIYGPLLDIIFRRQVLDTVTGNILGIAVSLLAFGGYCIWNDAYMSINDRPVATYILLGGIGGMNLLIGIMALRHDEVMEDGVVHNAGNLIIGIALLLLFLIFMVKNIISREE